MPDEQVNPAGKASSGFFVSTRKRGLLNAMLDDPAKRFEENNPGLVARWEYGPPNGDNTLIVARESLGYRVVDASELADLTESEAKSGPIRRGDLILMAAPADIVSRILEEDARLATEDAKIAENTYRDHIQSLQTRTSSGEVVSLRPAGGIKRTTEVIGVPEPRHDLAE